MLSIVSTEFDLPRSALWVPVLQRDKVKLLKKINNYMPR